MWVSFLVSLSSQNTNIFEITKKTLKKINIMHVFGNYFNIFTLCFIKLTATTKLHKTKIVCIHIKIKKKNEDIIKIEG